MASFKVQELRKIMGKHNIDAYMITSSDYHSSEYIGNYFAEREYISGFTGSNGTLVITKSEAKLWTDGRYYIQAEKELANSGIDLMRASDQGTLTVSQYLNEVLTCNQTFAYDGRTVSYRFASNLEKDLKNKNVNIVQNVDLVDEIWEDRPTMSKEKIYFLPIEYTGKSAKEKLNEIRNKMGENQYLVVSALDEICWTLNIRGNDVDFCPLVLSYLVISKEKVFLFIDDEKLSIEDKKCFKSLNAELMPYNEIYNFLKSIKNSTVAIDMGKANVLLCKSFDESVKLNFIDSPIQLLKASKNETELNNIKKAHLIDGIAVCKFIYWLKKNVGKKKITELDASEKLRSLREEGEGYIEDSFAPIVAYRENGAIVHYETSEVNNKELQKESFCLCDTGGHYVYGTTDITRTIALGKLTDDEKKYYTLVLKGNLNFGSAVIKEKQTIDSIDYLARQPLYENGANYLHGTSHGIGYLLNVHEGPRGILTEGVVCSNEPGFYKKDAFGVRLENVVAVRFKEETEYGKFYNFETLTLVPFDKDAIDLKMLTEKEIELLNDYHERVYKIISPYLNKNEDSWLKKATKKIKK